MTTYTLTVSTDGLGLGILDGCAVQIDRKRAVTAEQYPPVNVLYMIRSATDEDGVASFSIKPDDNTTYHVCTIWDTNGVPIYHVSFSMPPEASSLHNLSEAVIGASIQFQNQGVDIGTPPTTRVINFTGSSVNAVFSGETITVTIDDREYIDSTVSGAVAALADSSPATLDTLNEIAAALGDDPNFATTMMTALGNRLRVDAAQGLNDTQKRQARENAGIKRATAQFTTASTASGSTDTGTVAMATAFNLLSITTNYPARVRLYDTVAHRDADLSRAMGVYPGDDDGCFFEFITTSTLLSSPISRPVNGFNAETVVSTSIPYSVTNLDTATRAITTTFNYLPTE